MPRLAERLLAALIGAGRTVLAVVAGAVEAASSAGVARAVVASGCRTTVGLDLDQSTRDAGVPELVEHRGVEVGGKLDDREVRPDVDGAEIVTAEAALVRERADDLTRLDPVTSTDLDAVGLVVAPSTALARLAGLPLIAGVAFPRRTVVELDGLRQRVIRRVEQQRSCLLYTSDAADGG